MVLLYFLKVITIQNCKPLQGRDGIFNLFCNPTMLEFSRPEYWSGEPFPSPGDLPDSGIKPRSLALQADSLLLSHQGHPNLTAMYT